jgi:acyl-CoA thioester hydrolase
VKYRHKVRHKDTDSLGVVHHSNYLVFFEQARTEALRSLGIELPLLLERQGIQFAVSSVEVKYTKPARLDDTISILSKVTKLDRYSVFFEQHAFVEPNAIKPICSAKIRLAVVGHDTKLAILPANLQQGLMQ